MNYYSGVFTHLLLMSCAMFYATNASCSSSQFKCNNGNCVSSSYKCDYYDDCGDNSDEFGCGSCNSYQFQCFNGQCIDATLACNRVYNCNDGSDESRCTYTCPNGAVRLVGTGSNQAYGYGRVEICYNNTWGTMCGSSWSYNAATVVCRQLGFSGYLTYSYSALYGQGTGSILLYGLSCYGTESSLLYCSYSGSVVTTYCSHSQYASVTCYNATTSCSSSRFKCNNGKCVPSGYKCDKYDDCGDNSDEFGCGSCYSYQFQCFNGQCIDATQACNRVSNCSDGSDETGCTYTCPNGVVRLIGTGSNQASGFGRVEMCYNNTWGTMCGSSWNYNAATVVCRQLGFSGYSTYSSSALYGQGTGSILLYGLSCYGTESSLLYCGYYGSVVTSNLYCSHSQDASVTCYGATSQPTTQYYGSYTSSSTVGIGIGLTVFLLVFILVVVILTVVRVLARQAIIRRGLQTRVVTNAPAATTIVTTTTQNSTPPTAGFDYTGYTGYVPPPSYLTTGYPAPGSTGYPAPGYPGAPPS